MPDFHQPILLPTLHHLADTCLAEREELLTELSAVRPITLVIPALFSELEREALPHMLKQLTKVPYLSQVIISMNGMDESQWIHAKQFFARRLKGVPHTVLWNDGPELSILHRELAALRGKKYVPGKGGNVWMGIASILATGQRGVIVCHDSDILNYDRDMLWRLCLPVAHPAMDYVFAKSYYGRVRGRIYGRVTRLLVFPLLQSLRELFGSTPLLRYLAMFRYPLSGEFAADSNFLAKLSIAPDWGLEIGMLCAVFRDAPAQTVCQVDLGGNFEHKHQHLLYDPVTGKPDAMSGLMRMGREVIRTLLMHLWRDLGFSAETRKLDRLPDAYDETAQVLLRRYAHEAIFNGLEHGIKEEKEAVEIFGKMIEQLVAECRRKGPVMEDLPDWMEVTEALPDFEPRLRELITVD